MQYTYRYTDNAYISSLLIMTLSAQVKTHPLLTKIFLFTSALFVTVGSIFVIIPIVKTGTPVPSLPVVLPVCQFSIRQRDIDQAFASGRSYTINTPGRYCLVENVTLPVRSAYRGAAIDVVTSSVDINLQHYTLSSGTGRIGAYLAAGIRVANFHDVTVHDGIITFFGTGILFTRTDIVFSSLLPPVVADSVNFGHRVYRVTLIRNDYGITAEHVANASFVNNVCDYCYAGINVYDGVSVNIDSNDIRNTLYNQFFLGWPIGFERVRNSSIQKNTIKGIPYDPAVSEAMYGLLVRQSSEIDVTDNSIRDHAVGVYGWSNQQIRFERNTLDIAMTPEWFRHLAGFSSRGFGLINSQGIVINENTIKNYEWSVSADNMGGMIDKNNACGYRQFVIANPAPIITPNPVAPTIGTLNILQPRCP